MPPQQIHPDRARMHNRGPREPRHKRAFDDNDGSAEHVEISKIDLDQLKANIVFVTGITPTVTETALRTHFGDCGGSIQRVTLKSRYAHIEFDSKQAVQAALRLNGMPVVEGAKLKVQVAKESIARGASDVVFFAGFDTTLDVADVEAAVRAKVAKYGTIVGDIRIPLSHSKKALKRPKGVGYIKMSSVDEAKKVIKKLAGKEIAGGTLRLDFGDDMTTRPKKEKKRKADSSPDNDATTEDSKDGKRRKHQNDTP